MAKATAGGKKKVFRKKEKKNIPVGIAYIAASFNNTLISVQRNSMVTPGNWRRNLVGSTADPLQDT